MLNCMAKSKKALIWTRLSFAFVVVNIFVISQFLVINKAFIYGVYTGLFSTYLFYEIASRVFIRKNSNTTDERFEFIHNKAMAYSGNIIILLLAFAVIVLRAENLPFQVSAHSVAFVAMNVFVVLYVVFFAWLWKRY